MTSDAEGMVARYLKYATLSVIDNQVCIDKYQHSSSGAYLAKHDSYICVRGTQAENICGGDSGKAINQYQY